jgi:predicted nucleotidyltransferase
VVRVTARETALHLQALEAAERQRGQDRAGRLLARAAEARQLLVGRHGAGRVWLFGSLVAGEPTAHSDVDLAVEGLAGSAYFSALADLMALFQGPVDLVRIEEASESLRERVLSEGREL